MARPNLLDRSEEGAAKKIGGCMCVMRFRISDHDVPGTTLFGTCYGDQSIRLIGMRILFTKSRHVSIVDSFLMREKRNSCCHMMGRFGKPGIEITGLEMRVCVITSH